MKHLGQRPLLAGMLAALLAGVAFLAVELFRPAFYHLFPAATYLWLHALAELSSIVVSFAIFFVNWHAFRQRRNAQSLFVGVGFATVAALDTLHTFSFPGMPDFITPSSTSKGIVYWLAARLIESSTLLAAAFIAASSRSPLWRRRPLVAIAAPLVVVIFILNTYYPNRLPPLFVDGVGLTPLKVALEYSVIALTLATLAVYAVRSRGGKVERPPSSLVAALAMVVFGELAFTLYQSAYDTFNLLGHIYKVAAYYLIFRALFLSSIEDPYRDLARAQNDQARLYELERRKTRELVALGRLLTTSLNLDLVLQQVARAARELLEAAGAVILLYERQTDTFRMAAGDGVAGDAARQSLPAKGAVAGTALETNEARWITDLRSTPEIVTPQPAGHEFRSLVSVPLRVAGEAIGTLEAYSERPEAFGAEHLELLVPFADAAGIAIGNAHAYESIQRLERQKDDFLAIVAHDLRNPLTAIRGHSQLMMKRAQGGSNQGQDIQQFEAIDKQVSRMLALINQLLDVARIRMGRLVLQREPTDLRALIERVVTQAQLGSGRHEVTLRTGESTLCGLWDGSALEQVLANLVDNAQKYTPAGGQVEVTLARGDDHALVMVRDQGIGIPKEDFDHVFERYFRAQEAAGSARGLGLGLYIAKSIVAAHNGRIWLESEVGRGSTFYVTLPLGDSNGQMVSPEA